MKKVLTIVLVMILSILFIYLGFRDSTLMKEKREKNQTIYNDITNEQETSSIDTSKFEKAFVKRVVDGDTIIATIDGTDYRVRMIGMNTPESTTKIEPYGKEASNYTTSMLTNKIVYLEKDVSDTDKYNRLLRYVWLEIPTEISEKEIREKLFNANLLINGYANLYTFPPDIKYVFYLQSFESEARKNQLGLWGI